MNTTATDVEDEVVTLTTSVEEQIKYVDGSTRMESTLYSVGHLTIITHPDNQDIQHYIREICSDLFQSKQKYYALPDD